MLTTTTVAAGCRVRYRDHARSDPDWAQILGEGEDSDPAGGLIAPDSPLALVMLGLRAGEQRQLTTGGRAGAPPLTRWVTILEVVPPGGPAPGAEPADNLGTPNAVAAGSGASPAPPMTA